MYPSLSSTSSSAQGSMGSSSSSARTFLNHLATAASDNNEFSLTTVVRGSYDSKLGQSSGLGSRDMSTHPIMFSLTPAEPDTADVAVYLDTIESQLQFGMSLTTTENMRSIPRDYVPCKIRAKRGFATHPRSIAERERRTRISEKLKKLQDCVPNMEKQTSYADVLDLAVQHIKSLQKQVQNLNKELESCTCGCKNS